MHVIHIKSKGLIQGCFAVIFISGLAWFQQAAAQTVRMTMRDSTRITVKLKTYSDDYLHTWSGNFKLSSIAVVRFSPRNLADAEFFEEKLRQSGIVVYIGEDRRDPLPPPEDEDLPPPDTLVLEGRDYVSPKFYEEVDPAHVNVGFGGGLDYGGLGARITFYPGQLRAGIFGSVGYAIAGLGYNVGLNVRFSQNNTRLAAYGVAMYGYNATIKGTNAGDTQVYYGPTIGGGLEFRSRKRRTNFLNVEVLVPFRSNDFRDDYDRLKSSLNISVFPVTISVGYHFGIR